MSRSHKKERCRKESGTTPETRRLARHRLKIPEYHVAGHAFEADCCDYNDHVYREFEYEPGIREIREKYQGERRQIEESLHPLCYRLGNEEALVKLERMEKQELFHYLKRLRLKWGGSEYA